MLIRNIFMAAARGDAETVRFLLDSGSDVNDKSETGLTALAIAVSMGRTEVVELLISRGASIAGAFHGRPAEAMACDPEIRAILRAAAGKDLHDVAKRGDTESVRVLLDQDPNVDRRDEDERTALMLATEGGHADVVDLLLQRGADADARDKYGRTPLLLAASKRRLEITRILLEAGADPNAANTWNQTALYLAGVNGSLEIAAQLVDAGATVGLVESCLLGDSTKVVELLDAGEDINASGPAGMTLLMAAVVNGDSDLATTLLNRGSRIDALDGQRRTALAWAAAKANTSIVRLLLNRGANVNATGLEGHSALQAAVMHRDLNMTQLLLESGADPNLADSLGHTPLHWLAMASPKLAETIAVMLQEAGLDPQANADSAIMQALIDGGANIEIRDTGLGYTPLLSAVEMGTNTAVRCLLGAGANPNTEDKCGRAALAIAAGNGDTDSTQALLEAGANVNVEAGDMHLAALGAAAEGGHTDAVRLLIERGANVNPKEEAGIDPIVSAASGGHVEVLRLLLEGGAVMTASRALPAMLLAAANGHSEAAHLLERAIEEAADRPC